MTATNQEKFIDRIDCPDGFTKTAGEGVRNGRGEFDVYDYETTRWAMLESESVALIFNVGREEKYGSCCEGSTYFKRESGGWYTFDRRGIDSSFHVESFDVDPNEVVTEQIARVEKSLDAPEPIEIPSLGLSVSPSKKDEISKALKSGKAKLVTPSGMGTAYRLHPRPTGRRWDARAPKETEEFFGVDRIWLEHVDWD